MQKKGNTMSEYIDRNVVIDAFCSLADALNSAKKEHKYTLLDEAEIHGKISGIYICKGIIRKTKSADVAPVRHGRWIEYGENEDGTHNICCSVCNGFFKSKGHANSCYTRNKYRYCYNCGARMDEEVDDE